MLNLGFKLKCGVYILQSAFVDENYYYGAVIRSQLKYKTLEGEY